MQENTQSDTPRDDASFVRLIVKQDILIVCTICFSLHIQPISPILPSSCPYRGCLRKTINYYLLTITAVPPPGANSTLNLPSAGMVTVFFW